MSEGHALKLILCVIGSSSLLVIDYLEGLPGFWVLWEGPFVALLGVSILILARRVPDPSDAP